MRLRAVVAGQGRMGGSQSKMPQMWSPDHDSPGPRSSATADRLPGRSAGRESFTPANVPGKSSVADAALPKANVPLQRRGWVIRPPFRLAPRLAVARAELEGARVCQDTAARRPPPSLRHLPGNLGGRHRVDVPHHGPQHPRAGALGGLRFRVRVDRQLRA